MPAILQLNKIHKRYGPRVIFDDASVALDSEKKTGFIGRNGAGKSTLCNIITGQEPWRCGKVAGRFQLKHDLLTTTIKSLSGGYQTRVKLTAMLLRDPNFLILDEPSNYLDLKTLILLEEFLQDFDGGFLIVSHDREFLKKTCGHTLEA